MYINELAEVMNKDHELNPADSTSEWGAYRSGATIAEEAKQEEEESDDSDPFAQYRSKTSSSNALPIF